MTTRLVSDWREMYKRSVSALSDSTAVFYGRIGGSDTDMLIDYLEGKMAGETDSQLVNRVLPHYGRLAEFNGYYDKANLSENLIRFCQLMLACFGSMAHASLGGGKWQTLFFKGNLHPNFHVHVRGKSGIYNYLLEAISAGRVMWLYPFSFIEKTTRHKWSMFHAFCEILAGRRVLVVSPFGESIQKNFANKEHFFRDYDYPEFELATYNSPVTYSGLPEQYYPHQDWFETVEAMKAEVARMEFDIALLGCGSYAVPLGRHICETMGKKALYVGGVLQLYFGIMGRRYRNRFFMEQINEEYFITPQEGERYLSHVTVAAEARKDGFGAYF